MLYWWWEKYFGDFRDFSKTGSFPEISHDATFGMYSFEFEQEMLR